MARSANITYEEKIEIMKRYIEETGSQIKFNTVYEGYNIGIWQNNMRQDDRNEKLNISQKLRDEFEKIGVLGKRKRRKKITFDDKYEKIIKFLEENPDTEIVLGVEDKNGSPIGVYKSWIQQQYNEGKIKLNGPKIKKLLEMGIIKRPAKERMEIAKQYGISKKVVNYILEKYGDMDNFILEYKSGKIGLDKEELQMCGIQSPRVFALCSYDISKRQKSAYIRLVEQVCDSEDIKLLYNGGYINIDDINETLQTLSDIEQMLLNYTYGLNGEIKKLAEIGQEQGCSFQNVSARIYKTLEKIKPDFKHIVKDKDDFTKIDELLIEREELIIELDGYNYHMDRKIEELGLSNRTYNALKRAGINTVDEIESKTEEEFEQIKSLGRKCIDEIRQKLQEFPKEEIQRKNMAKLNEELIKKISKLNMEMLAYNRAYQYFINEENIFEPDEIIPASIIDEPEIQNTQEATVELSQNIEIKPITTLEEKKIQKEFMQKKYDALQEEVNRQESKIAMLEEQLIENGIEIPNNSENSIDVKEGE